jgi:uncharacterized membrane protein YdjX (TVP38/TMEM64 family)
MPSNDVRAGRASVLAAGADGASRPMTRTHAWWRIGGLAACVGAVFAAVALTGPLSADRVRDAVDPLGTATPVAFVFLAAALTVAMFPLLPIGVASGLLFSTGGGTIASLTGAVLGAAAAFVLGKTVAAEAVECIASPRVLRARDRIDERGFVAVLYARILPLPFSLVSYVAGLGAVKFVPFVAATALGTAPRVYAYNALGGNIDNLNSPEAVVPAVLLVAMFAVGTIVLARGRSRPSPVDSR